MWLPTAILKNGHDVITAPTGSSITTKFGKSMQNDMPMTAHTSKSKQEIEFQYGGRPFSENGSSFISAVEWDVSRKFGVRVEFHVLKQIPSLHLNPEVDFRLYDRYLEKSIWRHNSAADRPITTKFVRQMENKIPITTCTLKSRSKIEFYYGGRPFSETGSSFISAVVWAISPKFGMQIDFHLLKQMPSINLNPEVDFCLYGCHLEKSIWRHNSAADRPIITTFGTRMQNDMSMTTHTSKWKPPVFQNRKYSISAMDWDNSSKFGMKLELLPFIQVPLIEIA